MPRKPRIDPVVKHRARQLKAGGRSRDQVQKALAAEGHHVSAGWLSNAFREGGDGVAEGLAGEAQAWRDAAAEAAEGGCNDAPTVPEVDDEIDDAEALASDPDATIDDLRSALGALVPIIRGMIKADGSGKDCAKCGRGESNIDGVSKLTRALTAAGGLLVKVAPKAVADPNSDPDMIEAATRAKEKLASMIAAELKGAA